MSEKKIRTFISVVLSDEIKGKLGEVIESLRETDAGVRYVKPENAHLTLRFLGYVNESKVEDIKIALGTALQGIKPFDVSFLGIGAFPNVNVPKVVWAGIREGRETLHEIRDRLEENLSKIGIEKERRQYHSHLTVGRVKSERGRDKLVSWLKSNAELEIGSMKVSEIILMESMLKKEGPEYFPLKVVSLEKEEDGDEQTEGEGE